LFAPPYFFLGKHGERDIYILPLSLFCMRIGKGMLEGWKGFALGVIVVVVLVMLFYKPGVLMSPEEGETCENLPEPNIPEIEELKLIEAGKGVEESKKTKCDERFNQINKLRENYHVKKEECIGYYRGDYSSARSAFLMYVMHLRI
jgi:hypothetical protein